MSKGFVTASALSQGDLFFASICWYPMYRVFLVKLGTLSGRLTDFSYKFSSRTKNFCIVKVKLLTVCEIAKIKMNPQGNTFCPCVPKCATWNILKLSFVPAPLESWT